MRQIGKRIGLLALGALLASCQSSSSGSPMVSPDGSPSDTGPVGGGSDAAGTDTDQPSGGMACRTFDYGCKCTGEGNAPSCSSASVAGTQGAVGLCCKGEGSCDCEAFACVSRVADGYCFCSGARALKREEGTLGADCSAVVKASPGITCCAGPTGCQCSASDCSLVGQKVPSCDAMTLANLWCPASTRTNSCPQ
jgi:hypothetical protein